MHYSQRPHLTRSPLFHCLQHNGISLLPEVQTAEDKRHIFAVIDRTTKLALAEIHPRADKMTATQFLRNVIAVVTCTSYKVLTETSIRGPIGRSSG